MKEIWVRSADGDEISLCNSFSVVGRTFYCDYVNCSNGGIAREYASHERAIEVLDEIQQFLTPRILVPQGPRVLDKDTAIFFCKEWKWSDIKELNNNGVFQLPKE